MTVAMAERVDRRQPAVPADEGIVVRNPAVVVETDGLARIVVGPL
jgi:hypothetical protein